MMEGLLKKVMKDTLMWMFKRHSHVFHLLKQWLATETINQILFRPRINRRERHHERFRP